MYEEMRKQWEEDPYSYYQNLSRFNEIIENLEKYISLSPDSKEAVLAQWMLWQCFLQLPGKHKEAEKALMRYIDLYLSLKGKS
jgi:tetratricopeptide (TPR) repeat protein